MTDLARHLARWLTVLAALAAGAGVLAGCGDGAATGAKPASDTPRTTRAVSESGAPTDRASAEKALVGVADLPKGWTVERRYDEEGLICGSFKPYDGADAVVHSDRFHNSYTDIQQAIGVFPTEAASATAYRQLSSEQAQRCLVRTMYRRIRLHSGTDGIGIRIVPLQVQLVDNPGPESREVSYAAPFTSEVGVSKYYVYTVRTRVDRVVSSLLIVSSFAPVDFHHIAEVVIKRIGGTLS